MPIFTATKVKSSAKRDFIDENVALIILTKQEPVFGFEKTLCRFDELRHRDAGAVVGAFDADVVHQAFHEF